jgi:hypothetical protein
MATESYLVEEVQSLIHSVEDLAQWKELVAQCELKGQETLTKEEKSPIPFPTMTQQMEKVYNTLCPTSTPAESYNTTAIPIRILSLIALCKQEGYFDSLEVWSDDKQPDPIVVGFRQDPNSSWRKIKYLVGRWGDELRSYPELVKLAKERFTEDKRVQVTRTLSKCNTILANLENHVDSEFAGDFVDWPR